MVVKEVHLSQCARASNATFCNWKKKTNFDVVVVAAAGRTIRDPGSKDMLKIFTIFQKSVKKEEP